MCCSVIHEKVYAQIQDFRKKRSCRQSLAFNAYLCLINAVFEGILRKFSSFCVRPEVSAKLLKLIQSVDTARIERQDAAVVKPTDACIDIHEY